MVLRSPPLGAALSQGIPCRIITCLLTSLNDSNRNGGPSLLVHIIILSFPTTPVLCALISVQSSWTLFKDSSLLDLLAHLCYLYVTYVWNSIPTPLWHPVCSIHWSLGLHSQQFFFILIYSSSNNSETIASFREIPLTVLQTWYLSNTEIMPKM